MAIALTNERGLDVPVKTVDNKDNTFRIEFEPTTVGTYTANVFFADQEIPSSPYHIQVEPTIDVGRVMVQGLDDSTYQFQFNMICKYSYSKTLYLLLCSHL